MESQRHPVISKSTQTKNCFGFVKSAIMYGKPQSVIGIMEQGVAIAEEATSTRMGGTQ